MPYRAVPLAVWRVARLAMVGAREQVLRRGRGHQSEGSLGFLRPGGARNASALRRTRFLPPEGRRARSTAASGAQRSVETKLFPLQASLPGRVAMRGFFRLQRWFAHTELGNGFLLVARKPASRG